MQNGPYGQPIDGESAEPPQPREIAGSFSGQLAPIGADSPLREGCRVIYCRTQSMPSREQHHRTGITTVQIGARRLISGINLFPSG